MMIDCEKIEALAAELKREHLLERSHWREIEEAKARKLLGIKNGTGEADAADKWVVHYRRTRELGRELIDALAIDRAVLRDVLS